MKNTYTKVFILIIVICVVWNMPFFLAFFSDQYYLFTGMTGLARGDKAVYLSMIEQVLHGAVLVENIFTAETSFGLLHPLWLLLGVVAKFFNTTSKTIFHIASFLSGVGFLSLLFCWSRVVFTAVQERVLFLLGLGFFGGIGAFAVLFTHSQTELIAVPADLWWSEAFTFLTLHHSPLFILSQLAMLGGWWLVAWSVLTKKYTYAWVAGVLLLVLGLMHPFDLAPWWVVACASSMLFVGTKQHTAKELFRAFFPSILATAAVVVYYAALLLYNPALQSWNAQNTMPPPSLFALCTGFGFLIPLSCIGLWRLYKQYDIRLALFFTVWIVSSLLLMYVPVPYGRRLVSGVGIALVTTSVVALVFLYKKIRARYSQKNIYILYGGAAVVFLLLVMTPLQQLLTSSQRVLQQEFPEYTKPAQHELFNAVALLPRDSVVLAEPFIANIIPGQTGKRVWLGHDVQTVDFEKKYIALQRFYAAPWSEWHDRFVAQTRITHVVMQLQQQPKKLPSTWKLLWQNNMYSLWRVIQ